jgi:hypothetical protein
MLNGWCEYANADRIVSLFIFYKFLGWNILVGLVLSFLLSVPIWIVNYCLPLGLEHEWLKFDIYCMIVSLSLMSQVTGISPRSSDCTIACLIIHSSPKKLSKSMMACLMISRLIYISLDCLVYSKVGKVHVTPIKYSHNLFNPLKRLINPLFSPFAANSSRCSLPVH